MPGPDVSRRRQNHVRQELVIVQHVLLEHVLQRRHREVLSGRHFTFALRSDDPELRAVREQRHRQARRMHDVAGAVVAEDRVILVLPVDCKAA